MAHIVDRSGRRIDLTKASSTELDRLRDEFATSSRAIVDEQAERRIGWYERAAERAQTPTARAQYAKLADAERAKVDPQRVAQDRERAAYAAEQRAEKAASATDRSIHLKAAEQLREQAAEIRRAVR